MTGCLSQQAHRTPSCRKCADFRLMWDWPEGPVDAGTLPHSDTDWSRYNMLEQGGFEVPLRLIEPTDMIT